MYDIREIKKEIRWWVEEARVRQVKLKEALDELKKLSKDLQDAE